MIHNVFIDFWHMSSIHQGIFYKTWSNKTTKLRWHALLDIISKLMMDDMEFFYYKQILNPSC
jgi:hypothetical protein